MANSEDRIPIALKPIRRGDKISGSELDKHRQILERLIGGVREPQQVFRTANPGVPLVAQQLAIAEVHGDYLVCYPWDGESADVDQRINVAKPYKHRASLLTETLDDGTVLTYAYSSSAGTQRTATSTAGTETQVINPPYLLGDTIYAVKGVKGGTSVFYTINGKDIPVEWLLWNTDGRAWAKKYGT